MTGYTVHTGSNEKFTDGWDRIFKDKKTSAGKKANAAKKKPKRTTKSKKKS